MKIDDCRGVLELHFKKGRFDLYQEIILHPSDNNYVKIGHQ